MTSDNDFPHDDDLSAWIDGGMDKDGATRMANLAASDDGVARRATRLRRLDDLVRTAVPLDEDIPGELLARLGLAPEAAEDSSNVVELAQVRAARSANPAAPARRFAGLSGGWRIAAQIVLVLGVGLTGSLWYHARNESGVEPKAEYTALGDAPVAGSEAAVHADALVMFASDTNAGEARGILADAGAKVVSGPSANGVWQVYVAPARRDAVLTRLREHDGVTMAESLDGGE